jgi:hypothetical protein
VALRLTDLSPTATAAPSTSSAPAAFALIARARSALAVGDLPAFRALADETATLDDPHRRYVARRGLVELGLEHAQHPGADAPRVLLATAQLALDVLAPAPAEPVLLNLAGVAFFQAGSLPAAKALLEAAERLDPATTHLEGNLARVRQLKRERRTLRPAPAIAGAVKHAEVQALRLAREARPARDASISLCMIVRDEEATLARALASAAEVVDEVVVVDTGSTDRTVDIAREHGARVLTYAWNDDFAAARNVGLDAATGDWILFLDADEQLLADDAPKLRRLVTRTWREGFLLTIVNQLGEAGAGTALTQDVLRLFRNRPGHRFEGRIHEGVLHCMPADAPERLETAGVRVDHDGYLTVTRDAKDKGRRNLELLLRQLSESPHSAYLHFNLGSEHLAVGDVTAAAEALDRAWELLQAEPRPDGASYAPALHLRRAGALRACGRPEDAIAAAAEGLRRFEGYTDLVLEQAIAFRDTGDAVQAEALLRRCLELGDAPSRLAAVTGAGTFLAATALARLLTARGETAEAEQLLLGALAEAPRHVDARLALADALLTEGRYAAAADVAAGVPERSPLAAAAGARRAVGAAAAGADDARLPAHALPVLALTLNARLAAADVDGFVALLPLTERVEGVSARERREILASLYLAHGFLDSAADEWAAACEESGPDAAALTGLSRIAQARGELNDARLFAEGARELAGQA